MKIQTKNTHKKKIMLAVVSLLLLSATILAYAYYTKSGPFQQDSLTKPATKDEKVAGIDAKKQSLDTLENAKSKTSSGSDPLPAPTPSENGGKSTIGMEITAANQNGDTLNIRTLIQTISSTGTCSLEMTGPNGNKYTATTEVYALPSSTTCKGFDIPTTELTTGDWTISVTFENEKVKGTATKQVTIQ